MTVSKIFQNKFKTIDTVKKAPKWKSTIKVTIAETREKAKKQDEEDESEIKIYTDESGYNREIEAAAVMYETERRTEVARHHLGKTTQHTVFEEECIEQLLGLQLLEGRMQNTKKKITVSIVVDNQASLICYEK